MSSTSEPVRGGIDPGRRSGDGRSIADDYRTIVLNRVSWGAILAGVVTALVTHLLLNMLGLGIGLTTLDATGGDNPDSGALSMTAAVWWTVSGIVAAFVGGYVAARLTGQPDGTTGGWHGLVTWALTTLVILYLLTSSASALLGGALNRLGALGETAGQAASQLTGGQDPFSAIRDKVRELIGPDADQSARESISAAVRTAVTGSESDARAAEDRAVEALAQARGISSDEARQQIGDLRQSIRGAVQQTREAGEATRKVASQVAIFGVIALLLGAVAGWLGGAAGHPRRGVRERVE